MTANSHTVHTRKGQKSSGRRLKQSRQQNTNINSKKWGGGGGGGRKGRVLQFSVHRGEQEDFEKSGFFLKGTFREMGEKNSFLVRERLQTRIHKSECKGEIKGVSL